MMSSHDPRPRRSISRDRSVMMVAGVIAGTSILAFSAGAAALSRPTSTEPMSLTFQQQAVPGDPIPLSPLTDLTSLDATVSISADGTVDGEPTQGKITDVREIVRVISRENLFRRVQINAVQIGGGPVATEFMKALAKQSRGQFHKAF